ncbi:MAG: 3-deoxy-7-phosphoheptulonate synthase [Spirochaetaceae bacterium]|jgi:3-deoxy-7-phosphoheptulonate synthase|nr:3-deoxy-7-phosphoheptulonate synthase [Spirochaetaceae bacterium]
MIVVLAKDISPHDTEIVRSYLRDHGFNVRDQIFGDAALLGAAGKGQADIHELALLPGVERVAATSKQYELASRETQSEDSIVSIGPVKIGGARISVIAGPCAVESREQIEDTAAQVRESGAVMLRGGAYKPRTSPYAFQGLGMKGLEYMKAAGELYNMPIVTEVVSPELAEQMRELTDMFQIGARNMQNFELLKKVGSLGRPVLLKRGPSATIEEWLLSAEYLLAAGTRNVVLCERGIRTFETYTRNTLDISAIPVVKALSHLPIIVDPSHAVGIRAKVAPAALAAIAAGADGLTVEVHPNPDTALSDGPQSLYPYQFERLMRDIEALSHVVGKELLRTPRVNIPVGAIVGSSAPQASPQKIAFSGESGAYAEQALIRAFGEDADKLQTESFGAVFDAVLDGRAAFGVVPLENSLAGSIHENYDLFMQYPDIAIVGEIKLRIVHCLIASEKATMESIKVVRSHPQGFAQCREFLDKHPDWRLEAWNNTASAVLSISKETDADKQLSISAIASEAAAKAHGLAVLKAGIETDPRNYTRFVILSRKDGDLAQVPPSMGQLTPDKASLIFSVKDEPGSLYECLKILSEEGVNLSKLESRPLLGQPWNYLFYVDVSIPKSGDVFDNALSKLKSKTGTFHFLGCYHASL